MHSSLVVRSHVALVLAVLSLGAALGCGSMLRHWNGSGGGGGHGTGGVWVGVDGSQGHGGAGGIGGPCWGSSIGIGDLCGAGPAGLRGCLRCRSAGLYRGLGLRRYRRFVVGTGDLRATGLPVRCNNRMPAWLQHRRRLLYRPELRKRSSLCRHGLCHRWCLSRRLHLHLRLLHPQSLHLRLGLLECLRRRRALQHARDVRWVDGVRSLVLGVTGRRPVPAVPDGVAQTSPQAGCGSDTIGG